MMRSTRPFRGAAQRLAFAARPSPRVSPSPIHLLRATQEGSPPHQMLPLLLRTQFSTKPPITPSQRDVKLEKELAKTKLESKPEDVTTTSSIPGFVEGSDTKKEGPKRTSELSSDVHTVKQTLALKNVPQYPFALGIAGTLPYLATSVSTVYLSWDINMEMTQSSFINSLLLNKETATQYLHLLEPIQVGYGAVIISFLGAIHWGLEYAEKQPSRDRTRFRYGVGVAAPMLAWPTVFMPVEWALITQFLSFTGLYLADLRATARGWTPEWYRNYRFVLTAIVGTAIFVSLVGRAKVGPGHSKLSEPELRERLGLVEKHSEHNWEKEEQEERERIKKQKVSEEKENASEQKKNASEEKKNASEETQKAEEEKKARGEKKKEGGSKKKSDTIKEVVKEN